MTDRRATRRGAAVHYLDSEVKLRVLKPKRPGTSGPDGAYRYSYPDPDDPSKRVQKRWYGTDAEVTRRAKRLAKDLAQGHAGDWRDMTFRTLCDSYVADRSKTWNPRTKRNITDRIGVLCDEFGLSGQTLGALTRSKKPLREALSQLAASERPTTKRPFAASTLTLYHGTLGTVFAWGHDAEIIPGDIRPMFRIKAPAAEPGARVRGQDGPEVDVDAGTGRVSKALIPSMAHAERLAAEWQGRAVGLPWWRGLSVMLAATSGLRWSELHALRPVDIVMTGKTPHIAVVRQILHDANGKPIGWCPPKGNKSRHALLPHHLGVDLAKRSAEVRATTGADGLLFPAPRDASSPYLYKSFGDSFRRMAAHADWPTDAHGLVWTWHSLRHLAAVWQLQDVGIELATVSRGLGHTKPSFTMDRYVDMTSDSFERANARLRDWRP